MKKTWSIVSLQVEDTLDINFREEKKHLTYHFIQDSKLAVNINIQVTLLWRKK